MVRDTFSKRLEGWVTWATFEFLAHPFHVCLRVVFRIGEEIIQVVAFVAVHLAVLATALML